MGRDRRSSTTTRCTLIFPPGWRDNGRVQHDPTCQALFAPCATGREWHRKLHGPPLRSLADTVTMDQDAAEAWAQEAVRRDAEMEVGSVMGNSSTGACGG